MAVALAGCSKPDQEIVPYVHMPERLIPGEPLRFATSLELAGYARGVVAISVDGRPIKVEGNPRHPASLGATDLFAEAEILSLYDPDRSRTVLREGAIASWEMFATALLPDLERLQSRHGRGLRILTGRVTSPTLARQIDELLKRYPEAVWHAYEPVDDDAALAGAQLAYGDVLTAIPDLARTRVVLSLGADPLGPGPDQICNARAYAKGRDPNAGVDAFTRWYAIEPIPTLTGMKADNRLALPPHDVHNAALAIANILGAGLPAPSLSEAAERFVTAVGADLQRARGAALVLAGRTLTAEAHALVFWINAQLGAPLALIRPPDRTAGRDPASLPDLVRALASGEVDLLAVLDVNPVYDAPSDLRFAGRLARARVSIHYGLYADETAARCRWHVPASHAFEGWSDLRASDGTASLVQPLIKPLYATRTRHELLAAFTGRFDASPYAMVRQTWRSAWSLDPGESFEKRWRRALHDGTIDGSAAQPVTASTPRLPNIAPKRSQDGVAMVFMPDPCVWDGRLANNAWLQECPKPLTKEVWGNAVGIGTEDAKRLSLATGDLVRIEVPGVTGSIAAPVIVSAGHAPGVLSLTLGYGRKKAGAIGDHVGTDVYGLRTVGAAWVVEGMKVARTGEPGQVLTTQNYVRLEGAVRELFPTLTLAALARGASVSSQAGAVPSFYPELPYPGHAWAMAIDSALCIGCNACIVACQAENNVPVVGPEEIARGRDMHWLRVDVYDHGTPERPQAGFQPVPCMHCEKAPCEPVCPVAASVHDSEGLNLQVYNRCIGTRFCEANCPYKVRRFNFFGYADGQEYAHLGAESLKAQKNPEVTVRARGVMEKCTYCIQRIAAARSAEGRREDEVEVVTACQAACPTRAITFGDLNRSASAPRKLKGGPRHYALLGRLGTQPRTTYLAEVKNPNPALDGGGT